MTSRYWAVIPAAGSGRRMGADLPKQYLSLNGRPVLEHALQRLLDEPRIAGVCVVLSESDSSWPAGIGCAHDPRVWTVSGGAERCHSVRNALINLGERAAASDWILVHDAARPCLRASDLGRLLDELSDHPVGGLLAVPVRDTIKRVREDRIVSETVDRDPLWHAYTPQMFRLGALLRALEQAIAAELLVTDESAALERVGQRPVVVPGHADNIKITRPEDLALAAFFLEQQARAG